MARRVVVGDLRVQQIQRRDGRRSWTIVWPEGTEYPEADRFLRRHEGSGTQRTYAYVLVDHLRWLERECLTLDTVRLRDLERYMGILGAEVRMPLGEPWRVGKRPYGRAALSITASCLKGFYLHQAALGVNPDLGKSLNQTRLPSRLAGCAAAAHGFGYDGTLPALGAAAVCFVIRMVGVRFDLNAPRPPGSAEGGTTSG
jgi:hypothetical protein